MQAIDRFAILFESFSPADIERLEQWYMPDAHFGDPFSEVRGLPALRAVYRHMFEALDTPRFTVLHRAQAERDCFLLWEFDFGLRGKRHQLRGVSHLQLSPDGRIAAHRDHWDSAELYECFPGLGALMRWLRRRAGPPAVAPSPSGRGSG